jgi:hypothetical protein
MINQEQICTPAELKQFSNSIAGYHPTAFSFARFLECISGFKYTVIEIEFILDAFKMIEEQARVCSALNEEFKSKWGSSKMSWFR